MSLLDGYLWYFVALAGLLAASAFCSSSEAALFSLRPDERRKLRKGSAADRAAVELLERPERLLSALLFLNLLNNTLYFVLTSAAAYQLQRAGHGGEAGVAATCAMLAIIFGGEIGPKTAGVMFPAKIARLVSLPVAVAVRLLDPLMPALEMADRLLRRIVAPRFAAERYLEIGDLERAIELSTSDSQLAAQEQAALQNIVQLSDLTAEELMRPRNQYHVFRPPVELAELIEHPPSSGYALVSEPDSDEIAAAAPLRLMTALPRSRLEQFARSVVYVPWCASVAAVLEQLRAQEREVAAVVNELGETIGVVTLEDVLETVFEDKASRSARLAATSSIAPLGEDRWRVTGLTNLSRLSRHFDRQLESIESVTVGGMLQEVLQRIPQVGDEAEWSGLRFLVVEVPAKGPLKAELELLPEEGVVP